MIISKCHKRGFNIGIIEYLNRIRKTKNKPRKVRVNFMLEIINFDYLLSNVKLYNNLTQHYKAYHCHGTISIST